MMRVYELPLPPPLNHAYPTGKNGRRHKSERLTTWATQAGWGVKSQNPSPFKCEVYSIEIAVPMKMRGDIDGRIKAPVDLLDQLGIVPDDKHMRKVSCERRDDIAPDTCRVTVRL